jgi:hypothetical protein
MSVETAAVDRLPWLPDEPAPAKPAKRQHRSLLAAGAAALLVVAGVGSWMGYKSVVPASEPSIKSTAPAATVQLPVARRAAPEVQLPAQREVEAMAVPEVRPSPQREVRLTPPVSRPRRIADKPETVLKIDAPAAPPVVTARPVPAAGPWEPRVTTGAAGRLVQIGAFGSVRQAKLGWRYMVRAYPALSRLPSVVRPTRNSKGRVFYRFRIGTTSQAHSEVLCQRMQRIQFSCAVVGLPWKAKVER